MHRFLVLFLFSLAQFTADAKRKYIPDSFPQPNFSIEANFYSGIILRHTPKFFPTINEPSFGAEIAFCKTTFGKEHFERKFFYPRIGGSIIALRFGNNAQFGNAYGIFPHIGFWIKRSNTMDLYFRMGIGLAYLTTPYDINTNPTNNVIGSNINNITQFKFGIDWKFAPKINLNTSFSFTHFSNARSQLPNLGINYTALNIGIVRKYGVKKYVYNHDSLPRKIQRNFYVIGFGISQDEKGKAAYGPVYPGYNFFTEYHRATSIANHLVSGVNVVYNKGTYNETQYRENNESKITSRTLNSMEAAVYFGDEIVLKNFGFFFHFGIYCFYPYRYKSFMYQRIGGQYYLPPFSKNFKGRLFIGADIKSHLNEAVNYEIRTGMRF